MPRPPRGLAAIVVVCVLLALSGCVRLRTDVVIRSDDQVTVSVDLGTLRLLSDEEARLAALRVALEEGETSGFVADFSLERVLEKVKARRR